MKTHGSVAAGNVENGATGADGGRGTVGTQRNAGVAVVSMMVPVTIAVVKFAGGFSLVIGF